MFTAFKNSYGKSDEEVAQVLSFLPVIHLHGRLGGLLWQGQGGRDYAPDNSLPAIKAGMEDIKIIHEDISSHPQFGEAQQKITTAKITVFLGFGYDETNLQRLGFDLSKFPGSVYGSCYGFTRLERELLRHKAGEHINLGQPDEKVLTFLRNNVPLS